MRSEQHVTSGQRHAGGGWAGAMVALGLSFLALGVLYRHSFASMVGLWWHSQTFAHGFLVFPISIYLVWRRRSSLRVLTPKPSLSGLISVPGLGFVWLLGRLADVQAVQHVCVIAMVPALVVGILGWRVARTIGFPLGFLAFAAPVGEWLVPSLMDLTARMAMKGLQWSGVPAVMEGRFIQVPGGSWIVTKACSGVRYLIASLALGSLFAYVTYRSLGRRLAFFTVSAIVPIVANGIRAYGIILLGYLSENRIATGIDHIIYGWIFFVFVMFLLFWLGSRWQEPQAPVEPTDSAGERSAAVDPATPGTIGGHGPQPGSRVVPIVSAVLAIVLLSSAPLAREWIGEKARSIPPPVRLYPDPKAPWSMSPDTLDSWHPSYPTADREARVAYQRDRHVVHLFVAYYGSERQGSELINFKNRIYDERLWRQVSDGAKTVVVAGQEFRLHETRVRREGRLRIIWYWYLLSGRATANVYMAKYLEAESRLLGQSHGDALVAVAADCGVGDGDRGQALLVEFLGTMGPEIPRVLLHSPAR